MPFFSVIITTYNRMHLLPTAINSVLEQEFTDFEIIVIDDASTDGTKELISQLDDKRIQYFQNEKNLHKGGARNVGIKKTKGKYVCFLDDDDYYLSHHLSTFYKEINKGSENTKAMYYTLSISKDSKSNKKTKRYLDKIGSEHPVAYLFNHKNGLPTPLACIERTILNENKFNPTIRIGQDTELFLRIATQYPIKPIDEHTVVQIHHGGNSGGGKYNNGLDRLKGYEYLFKNKDVSKHISRKLKRHMISYCYLRMCEYYDSIQDRKNTLNSGLKTFYYSPFDKCFKIKMVFIIYNLPLTGLMTKKIVKKLKHE